MTSPHDSLFCQVFADPKHAVGELRALLPAAVERLVAWDTLERLPGTHKDVAHGEKRADLLFEVEIGGRPARLYLLLEHKSTAEPWTAFQLLRYVVRVLEQFRRENPHAGKLPPIVARVVHHSRRGWRRSTELSERFDLDATTRPVLGPFLPQLRFLLDDLSQATPELLAARSLSAIGRLTLLCLQRIRSGHDLATEIRRLRDAFRAALTAGDTGDLLAEVLSYIGKIEDLGRAELQGIIRVELGPELEQVMTSTYDQVLNEGVQRGVVIGTTSGKAEGTAETLLKLIAKRFGEPPPATIARIRGADLATLDRWVLRFVDASSLEQIFADA